LRQDRRDLLLLCRVESEVPGQLVEALLPPIGPAAALLFRLPALHAGFVLGLLGADGGNEGSALRRIEQGVERDERRHFLRAVIGHRAVDGGALRAEPRRVDRAGLHAIGQVGTERLHRRVDSVVVSAKRGLERVERVLLGGRPRQVVRRLKEHGRGSAVRPETLVRVGRCRRGYDLHGCRGHG
jgi:hypothetical protein